MSDEYDVVVAGSGAAGMTAALAAAHRGLSVVVLEKAACFGGSTARSGGGVWLPGNHALRAAGIEEPPERARQYLESIVGDVVPERLRTTFLDHGPEVLEFVTRNTPLEFQWVPGYSDYHPEAPGGRPGGRSVEPKALDGKLLGADL
ncbi:FAD-dependent oxidoreductase, partial [Amycolatopsis sp. NPDC000740]